MARGYRGRSKSEDSCRILGVGDLVHRFREKATRWTGNRTHSAAPPGGRRLAGTRIVLVDDLADEYSVFDRQLSEQNTELRKHLVGVAAPGDWVDVAIFDVSQRAEAVVLQLKQPVQMIERRVEAPEPHVLDAGK